VGDIITATKRKNIKPIFFNYFFLRKGVLYLKKKKEKKTFQVRRISVDEVWKPQVFFFLELAMVEENPLFLPQDGKALLSVVEHWPQGNGIPSYVVHELRTNPCFSYLRCKQNFKI